MLKFIFIRAKLKQLLLALKSGCKGLVKLHARTRQKTNMFTMSHNVYYV